MMMVIGMTLGLGLYLFLVSVYDLMHQRFDGMQTFEKRFASAQFALNLNTALIGGISSTLVAGVFTPSFLPLTTVAGLILGWVFAVFHEQRKRKEELLQIALATATLSEDCAILSTTHLGIRQSLAMALASSHPALQHRVKRIMDVESEHVLLVAQLKELARVEQENALGRFARTLAIALERGNSPEASLLHLATEVRTHARRELLHLAAKKEIAMMIPVVFAVLPSVTAVALFPAMKSLEQI